MRPRQFDLIAFDWDGTLFDSTALIVRCIQAAVHDVGGRIPSDRAASYVIGMGLMQALAHAAPDVPPARYPLLGERYRYHYQQHQDDISLFDGVLPLLAELKQRHHWLTVATGKSRQGLDTALRTVELHGVFDGSRTADETAGKPSPLMLHELMGEFGVDPARTLIVGTDKDVDGALYVFGLDGRIKQEGKPDAVAGGAAHQPLVRQDQRTIHIDHHRLEVPCPSTLPSSRAYWRSRLF